MKGRLEATSHIQHPYTARQSMKNGLEFGPAARSRVFPLKILIELGRGLYFVSSSGLGADAEKEEALRLEAVESRSAVSFCAVAGEVGRDDGLA